MKCLLSNVLVILLACMGAHSCFSMALAGVSGFLWKSTKLGRQFDPDTTKYDRAWSVSILILTRAMCLSYKQYKSNAKHFILTLTLFRMLKSVIHVLICLINLLQERDFNQTILNFPRPISGLCPLPPEGGGTG